MTTDYFGHNITYTLPTISDLIACIQQQGKAAHLWKADLARAYRQLRVDPIDTPFLGTRFDGQFFLDLCIPGPKLNEFLKICKQWINRRRAKKKALQSLAGKMAYISGCVTQGRKFMCRVLSTLRSMKDREWTSLSEDFRLDVKWFYNYSRSANGIALFTTERASFEIECDSSLEGAGGAGGQLCYTWKYNDRHMKAFKNIHELEAVNTIVAFNTLCPSQAPHGAKIIINTDNISSAHALESGRTTDPTLGACARELWLLVARHDFDFFLAARHPAQTWTRNPSLGLPQSFPPRQC